MELLQQQQLPEPVELGARIVAAAATDEELGVVQPLLARGGCRASSRACVVYDAAVVLEVQLADDDRPLAVLRLERVEELVAASRCACAAGPAGRARARSVSSIVARRAAAAVAVAEDEQARPRVLVVLVVARAVAGAPATSPSLL